MRRTLQHPSPSAAKPSLRSVGLTILSHKGRGKTRGARSANSASKTMARWHTAHLAEHHKDAAAPVGRPETVLRRRQARS
jgi:hypothetical protein